MQPPSRSAAAPRFASFVRRAGLARPSAGALVALAAAGCASRAPLRTVEAFEAARERSDLPAARALLAEDPRLWFEAREGPGEPWTLGAERWEAWDAHFRARSEPGPWHVERDGDGHAVWRVVQESNDYYRLLERRDTPRHRATTFVRGDGRIAGRLICAVEPSAPSAAPRDRSDDFCAWAAAREPEEWAYLRPAGRLDPSGDRAPRTRALLERWRAAVGLAPLE